MASETIVQKDPPRTFKCTPGCLHPQCIKLPERPVAAERVAAPRSDNT